MAAETGSASIFGTMTE